ncbi:MAG TPA: hypothetical protein VM074_04490 [Solimonas sp.]|nr:hypothetical protein [Solimonas sp.]
MRKLAIAVAVGASMGVGMLAIAASPLEQAPEFRAYLSAGFGGAPGNAQAFFYGLRLDHDRRFQTAPLPPLAQLQFGVAGFDSVMVNGMPLARSYLMQQDEGGAPPATTMSALDWGLVLVGVAGVGFAVAEVSSSDESPDPGSTGGTGTGGGTTGGGGGTPLGGTPVGGELPTCAPDEIPVIGGECLPIFTGTPDVLRNRMQGYRQVSTPEYQEWLDGGSGHMGDLVEH